MKLIATPLLEPDDEAFEIQDLKPREFCHLLDSQKALVLKSDNPLSVEDFGSLLVRLNLTHYPYIGGAAPRTIVPVKASPNVPIIFTANESPPHEPIPFHHEIAQVAEPPTYIFFYCDVAAKKGGQTPIIDSTKVYRYVKDNHPEFLDKLLKHGVRYIRTLPSKDDPSSPLGRSYQNSWNVSSRQELEERLSKIDGCEWSWHDNGDVTIISEPIPAIRFIHDSLTQNFIHQGTFCNSLVAAFLGWEDSRNCRLKSLKFGNDDDMDLDILQNVANYMHKHRVLHNWEHGDILALHNRLVMHSREPFEGARRVLASIWGSPQESVVLQQPTNGIAIGFRPESYYKPLNPSDPCVFGFWKVPKNSCADVAYKAIENGYRRLDSACDYGNETEVGEGITRAIHDGLVTRDELYITSKLWVSCTLLGIPTLS